MRRAKSERTATARAKQRTGTSRTQATRPARNPARTTTRPPAPRGGKAPAAPVRPPKTAKTQAKSPSAPVPASAAPEVRASPRPAAVASTQQRQVASSGGPAGAPDAEGLRIGDDLAPLVRGPIARVDVAKWCAATGEFPRVALDEPFARAAGLPSTVVPGTFAVGLLTAHVGAWLGSAGVACTTGVRLLKMVWPGDVLTARARIAAGGVGPAGRRLELDAWVENQKGELVVRGVVSAQVPGCHAPLAERAPEPVAPPPPAPEPVRRKGR